MNTTTMPGNSDIQAINLELARLKMAQELRKRFDLATELLALGQVSVSEALEMIQTKTAEEYINRSQEEKREKKLQLLILTKIEGIDMPLAEDLIDEFVSLDAIAQATSEEMENVPGIDKNRAEEIIKEVSKLVSQM